jgi:hypothetical protein
VSRSITNEYKPSVSATGDVNKEVFIAGDDEHTNRLGKRADPIAESFDDLGRGRPDADSDKRLDRPANRAEFRVKGGTPNDAPVAQCAAAVKSGAGRNA